MCYINSLELYKPGPENVFWICWLVDPPDPPTRLKIQNVRKGTVTLTWKAPKNDGGSPITHYSVDLLCWDASGTQKESWRR